MEVPVPPLRQCALHPSGIAGVSRGLRARFLQLLVLSCLVLLGTEPAHAQKSLAQIMSDAERLRDEKKERQASDLIDQIFMSQISGISDSELVTKDLLYHRAGSIHNSAAKKAAYGARDPNNDYAKRAEAIWRAYISWFDQLSDKQQSTLSLTRAYAATKYLADSLDLQYRFVTLFAAYKSPPVKSYLNHEAMNVWTGYLYSCPGWASEASTEQEKIAATCNPACSGEFRDLASALKDWAGSFNLRKEMRDQYLQNAAKIQHRLKQCP